MPSNGNNDDVIDLLRDVVTNFADDLKIIKDSQLKIADAFSELVILQHDMENFQNANIEARTTLNKRMEKIEDRTVTEKEVKTATKVLADKISIVYKVLFWGGSTLITGLLFLILRLLHI